jgi:hypothetical protein
LSKNENMNKLLFLMAYGSMAVSLAYTVFSLYVSHLNYPGGTALRYFNQDFSKSLTLSSMI